jgi:anhydro-N-acetylmuramic acid kinase
MKELAVRLAAPVVRAEALGWSSSLMEAQAFAYLAVRSLRGLPLSFPTTTGVPVPQCGGILSEPVIRSAA